MKKQRFTESQIMHILKQAEGGVPVVDLCREHGMSIMQVSINGAASMVEWTLGCFQK